MLYAWHMQCEHTASLAYVPPPSEALVKANPCVWQMTVRQSLRSKTVQFRSSNKRRRSRIAIGVPAASLCTCASGCPRSDDYRHSIKAQALQAIYLAGPDGHAQCNTVNRSVTRGHDQISILSGGALGPLKVNCRGFRRPHLCTYFAKGW